MTLKTEKQKMKTVIGWLMRWLSKVFATLVEGPEFDS